MDRETLLKLMEKGGEVLVRFFELTKGNISYMITFGEAVNEWGWTDEECDQVEDYLVSKGFIKRQTLGGTRIASFSLTRLGRDQAERLILNEPIAAESNKLVSGGINQHPLPAAATPSNPSPSTMTLAQFNKLLRELFSESDLQDFCLALRVDYESLPGDSKADKTRELILELQRRGRIPHLLTLVKQERPHISWPDTISD